MDRLVVRALDAWLARTDRKPLVLRGARQVGKTWLVRDLARRSGRHLVEINLERDPTLRRHFASNDPKAVLGDLSVVLGRDIDVDRALLFLDEIQAAPELFAKLRWFGEELPALPVVGAGSLLELALADLKHSVPVGRIAYLHVEPMGFEEFLRAHAQSGLLAALSKWHLRAPLSPATHEAATRWWNRYAMVGGMPAVVAADVATAEPRALRALQRELVATFRDDFAKYAGRMNRGVLDATLLAVAAALGRKYVYARAGEGVKQHQAKRALELLADARLCHMVRWTAANGLPLGGETKDTFRKAILLDVGLLHALLGTPAGATFPAPADLAPAVRGQLAEQLAGQTLRLLGELSGSGPELYYWQREGGRPGEIDYVVQLGTRIVPVAIKAGAAGAMKSLHQFMLDKTLDTAVRLDANVPSVAALDLRTTQGHRVAYRLVSLPPYLAWRLADLVR